MCADSARFALQTLAKKPDTSFYVTGSPRCIQSILKTREWYNYNLWCEQANKLACSSGKALHVKAEDRYHSNDDAWRKTTGDIYRKCEPMTLAFQP